jgi:molybdenum cofactor synthesis domain-containing protein
VEEAILKAEWGIEGDAHAGTWHRQISLLSADTVDAFNREGADVADGDFGENILAYGLDFPRLPAGTVLVCGEVVLRMTQIGKTCHSGCDIQKRAGKCIMPTEGVFAKVLHGGTLRPGMPIEAYTAQRVFILCASDRGYEGEREDGSTPALRRAMTERGYEVVGASLLPDDRARLSALMACVCDSCAADLLLTTGGTGLSPRDVTPEATTDIAQRMVPGLAELMRLRSLSITERASLSRAVCAIRNQTLIVNLPGSPSAAVENIEAILGPLSHGLAILQGTQGECAVDSHI